MKIINLSGIKDEEFLRLTGIKYSTFNKILKILKEAELKKFYRDGKPNKLLLEDRILMSLEYWREYRTYFILEKVLVSVKLIVIVILNELKTP